mmetsp:Transcript_38883/g.47085  ORF Transcript_38883/g.47085 Transcript_38883/m.47085 type:complete len:309 (+) Transcript_38883:130-1056(+)|eukprot:CAMPEP_0197859992 /NCGR_PEP_ID=MMETSP1438-20131217/35044_1 /TAXON_ID=1461541 /ORGANISM="Pterosperma sp., Strain CCMP1384" /LENGTH=308 /DNA_ID=CAMNT_0043476691 /DNA_START=130 /DNA_END=1056 /DNA_ORIENTATION=-
MQLSLVTRSGRELVAGGLTLKDDATVNDLQLLVHALSKEKKIKGPELYLSRQRFTIPSDGKKPTALQAGKSLASYGIKSGDAITFKDLGPQIGYQTVFFWEYFGPLVIFPLFMVFRKQIYGVEFEPSEVQYMANAYWVFHYFKRIAETFLVHSFSHATMPIANLFRNCSYYWGFAAACSYFINHNLYTSPPLLRAQLALGLALLCQMGNLSTHLTLANLRAPGQKGYSIPRGFGFNFITCANYTFEIYGWALFNVATQSLLGLLFMTAGAGQMVIWAQAKHKRLKQLFDGKDGREKYPRRYVILPPFI